MDPISTPSGSGMDPVSTSSENGMNSMSTPSGSGMEDPLSTPSGSGMNSISTPSGSGMDSISMPNGSGTDHYEANCGEGISGAKGLAQGRKRRFSADVKDSRKSVRIDQSEPSITSKDMIHSQPMKMVITICRDIAFSKMISGAAYGVEVNIYKPSTIADLELSTPQCLLLALLHSLRTGDINTCVLLVDICQRFERLRSRHLLDEFSFPRNHIEDAITLLVKLVNDDVLKLPAHVTTIMTSLATKYGITGAQLGTLLEESRRNLAIQLENAVTNNSPRDIIELQSEGADVCGLTQSGDSLLHLAARSGCTVSIAALAALKADLEVVNSRKATPLEEAVRYDRASSVKALLLAGAKFDKRVLKGDTYLHIAAAGCQNEALEALLEGEIYVNEKNHLGETPLVQAVRAGNLRGVELLIKKGADCTPLPELKLKNDDSIVHSLACSGNVTILKLLRVRDITANIKNQYGHTPLHVACNPSVVRILLRMGVDVNSKDNSGSTPLIIAARNIKVDIVSILLLNMADPNIKDVQGKTALHYATEAGCPETVATLLDGGAKVYEKDNEYNTPAFIAALNNKPAVLSLLMERGDLSLRDSSGDTILHYETRRGRIELVKALLDAGMEVDTKGQGQRTALHNAVVSGHIDLIQELLKRRAAVNMKEQSGRSALCLAICESVSGKSSTCNSNRATIVKLLLDAGAEVNMKYDSGMTVLHYAAKNGNTEVVKLLLDAGATVDMKDQSGRSALCLAICESVSGTSSTCNSNRATIVKLLLDAGAEVNMKYDSGMTALHYAAKNGNTEVVKLLLDAEATVDMKDQSGMAAIHHTTVPELVKVLHEAGATLDIKDLKQETALHKITRDGPIGMMIALLDAGAAVNARGSNGETALHLAAGARNSDKAKALLDRGAEINARDNDGKTAFTWAKPVSSAFFGCTANTHDNVINYLQSRGGTS